jgi:hypothetical protein
MTKAEIEKWIVHEGGVCEEHFGGDPNAKPTLNISIQQRPGELAECIEYLLGLKNSEEKIEYYAEIGACSGGTTFTMNKFLNFKELLIIDDGGAEASFYITDRKDQLRGGILGTLPRIEIIGNSSDERVIKHAINISQTQKYDLLFIDGDHTYDGVKSDTINYYEIVREGGYLLFHDTSHLSGVMSWMSEINQYYPNLQLIKHFHLGDPHTNYYSEGIGLTLYKKIK